MKKSSILFATLLMASTAAVAQTSLGQPTPQIQVNGVGTVNVAPDKVTIRLGVENKAEQADAAKKANDEAIAKVLKFIKGMKIDEKCVQTQRVSLYKTRDYEEKKDYFQASQSITVVLKDISKYESFITGVMNAGINRIDGVSFESSKVASFEAEARALAVKDAKQKATDYANALGQKAGKAILVTDGSSYSPPVVRPMYMMKGAAADVNEQTLAVGEIEVVSNISISFSLE
ncbi:MAG: SIMPL domain-containing protein [Flavobacteriaceae bacterium]|jgi:uncharacterized protein YggE|nr:SIMPL domain-containing protein [Flavobacteriaceae bacterium]